MSHRLGYPPASFYLKAIFDDIIILLFDTYQLFAYGLISPSLIFVKKYMGQKQIDDNDHNKGLEMDSVVNFDPLVRDPPIHLTPTPRPPTPYPEFLKDEAGKDSPTSSDPDLGELARRITVLIDEVCPPEAKDLIVGGEQDVASSETNEKDPAVTETDASP